MRYQVLLFMAKERMSALDVGEDGKTDGISIEGNDMMTCTSETEIREFCQHIKDYYNINRFSEIDISITILRFDSGMEDVFLLLEEFRGAKECNLVNVEKLLPWLMLKEGLLKTGTSIQVRTFDFVYTVIWDQKGNLRCETGGTGKNIFTLPKEKFAGYHRLDKNGLQDYEDEKKELIKKFDSKLKNNEKRIKDLEKQVSEEKKRAKAAESRLFKMCETESERERNGKRKICRLKCEDKEMDNTFQNEKLSFRINHFVKDAEIVETKEEIAEAYPSSISKAYASFMLSSMMSFFTANAFAFMIKAKDTGRIFWLCEPDSDIEYGTDIAIIGDVSDTKEDVMKWYKKNK